MARGALQRRHRRGLVASLLQEAVHDARYHVEFARRAGMGEALREHQRVIEQRVGA